MPNRRHRHRRPLWPVVMVRVAPLKGSALGRHIVMVSEDETSPYREYYLHATKGWRSRATREAEG